MQLMRFDYQASPSAVDEPEGTASIAVTVFPNPSDGRLWVKTGNDISLPGTCKVTLFDFAGRAMREWTVSPDTISNIFKLEIPGLEGCYYLRVTNGHASGIAKIILLGR